MNTNELLSYLLTAKESDPMWIKLEGKFSYSKFFKAWLRIYSVNDMRNWYFMLGSKVLKAQTPLIYFVKEGMISDQPEFKKA